MHHVTRRAPFPGLQLSQLTPAASTPGTLGVSPFPPHPWLPHVSHHKAALPWHPPPCPSPCLPGLSSPWHFPFPNPQHPTPASVSPSSRAEPRQPPLGALHCFKPTLPRCGLICSSNTLCNCSSPLPLPSQLLLLLKLEIATFKCFSEPPTGYNKNVAIGATRYKGL